MIIILHQSSNWICHKLNVCSGHLLYSVDCLNYFLWHVTCVGPCDGLIPIQGSYKMSTNRIQKFVKQVALGHTRGTT